MTASHSKVHRANGRLGAGEEAALLRLPGADPYSKGNPSPTAHQLRRAQGGGNRMRHTSSQIHYDPQQLERDGQSFQHSAFKLAQYANVIGKHGRILATFRRDGGGDMGY